MTTILRLSPADLLTYRDPLAALLCDAVNNGASVSFQPPLEHATAAAFWDSQREAVTAGRTLAFAALDAAGQVAGCVLLVLAWQPNAPHRAEIQKMLVHSSARRQGIATRLMRAAEDAARESGRWLIFLDTDHGSDAEPLYRSLGYHYAGGIPAFSRNHHGIFTDNAIYYKRLDTEPNGDHA